MLYDHDITAQCITGGIVTEAIGSYALFCYLKYFNLVPMPVSVKFSCVSNKYKKSTEIYQCLINLSFTN